MILLRALLASMNFGQAFLWLDHPPFPTKDLPQTHT